MLARKKLAGYATTDFTVNGTLRVPPRWIAMIATATWVARVKNRLAGVLAFLVLLGMLLAFVVMVELEPLLSADWPRLNAFPREAVGWLGWLSASPTWPSGLTGNAAVVRSSLITLGTAALTGLATSLVFLGRRALRGESGRRGINVLWDVISFWPRSAHPFVPAAYSQRAVPDLVGLIRAQLADDNAELVLCGHSQGSLLSFAALLRLQATDAGMLERMGLLLSWSHDRTAGTAERIDSWVRLPATRVEGRDENGPDWRLADPPIPAQADLSRAVLLPIRKHSDYWLDPAWTVAVAEVRAVDGWPDRVVMPGPAAIGRAPVVGGFEGCAPPARG